MSSLRSKTSFVLVDLPVITVWHGTKSEEARELAMKLANFVMDNSKKFGYETSNKEMIIKEVEEGKSDNDYLQQLDNDVDRHYIGKRLGNDVANVTPRLFRFNTTSSFKITESLCPHRNSSCATPYPFFQNELYAAEQPGIVFEGNKNQF